MPTAQKDGANRTRNPKSTVHFVDSQSVTSYIQTEKLHYAVYGTDGNQPTIRVNLGNVDIEGVRHIFDDIIVRGPNVEEHDKRLRKLLDTI